MSERVSVNRWLVDRSLEIICDNQHPDGSFPAAPDYPTYQYCWIRDGAFIAHALDRYDHRAEAAAFHRWVGRTVLQHRHKVDLLARFPERTPPPDEAVLHTRYTLDGAEGPPDWGNFQLDGYGFWLSSLAHHLTLTGSSPKPFRDAVELVTTYLTRTWRSPCYDCWEEYPTSRHPTTLAAVAAGLRHAAALFDDPAGAETADDICHVISARGTHGGSLVKLLDDPEHDLSAASDPGVGPAAIAGHEHPGKPLPPAAVDASALLVLGDFGPYLPVSPLITATLERIEADLVVNGGVHRYLEDEYYGGGLWILLSGALALIHARRGSTARAGAIIDWIERQADGEGNLPEQVTTSLRHPDLHRPWVDRWGPGGKSLLWSHAMYLIAVHTAAIDTPEL